MYFLLFGFGVVCCVF